MKVQEIRELIKLVDQSSIDEFEFELDGAKIKMKKNAEPAAGTVFVQPAAPVEMTRPAAVPAAQAPAVQEAAAEKKEQPAAENLHTITSPMVGTFYSSPSPEADDYVREGSRVSKNSVVCIVEAMKLFNEIEAEVNGEIAEILVKDGQLVEYGQPLFLVKPE
ncbi:acetyl-CoA carboxylase biotin carboxyl carrier protein [Peribacillus kribbensis]|uniref:acetyl-CoA carboxylase biotin carboxyl carrier protein n=1 Tax=Peribacillus kribbensis TaxID=356658 RepID=UPI00040F3F2E|nr:acetyl-CoA carboxylase biotin carboxyl carrier protein [Peribacillus kribbensis]